MYILILTLLLFLYRYSSANVDGTLSQQQKYNADGFSCSVAPQYWTWGNHISGKGWQLCNFSLLLFNKREDGGVGVFLSLE